MKSGEGMTREFVILPEFDKKWKEIGFTDNELKTLQEDGRGKSGSARACYVDFAVYEKIYLITAYTKNEKANLSKEERNEVKRLIGLLKDSFDRR